MAGVTLGNWNMEVLLSHVVYIIEVLNGFVFVLQNTI